MTDPDPWRRWINSLSEVSDAAEAERVLTRIAPEVAALLSPGQPLQREWQEVGVDIDVRPLATSGMCVRGTRRILVRRRDRPPRQRYTIAHELAHLLLDAACDGRGVPMGVTREEAACERFASRVLIPRADLCAHIERQPLEPSVDWLIGAARRFRASLSATVIALGEVTCHDCAFLLARRAGHPKRPQQLGLRIAHSAAPDWLVLPTRQRITSLGFHGVAAWEHGREPGSRRSEVDSGITLRGGPGAPSWTAGYRGRVASETLVLSGAYRLALALDVSGLEAFSRVPVRRRRSTAGTDQLALVS